MSHAGAGRSASTDGAGDLAQLVAVEQALEQRLTQTRVESRALVEEAVRESERLKLAYNEEAAAARSRLETQVEQEQRQKTQEILIAGRERAARYDALSQSKVAGLAANVLECVLPGSQP